MTYGHAEGTLAAIRLLEAETRKLLSGLGDLEPEHAHWLRDAADSASRHCVLPAPQRSLTTRCQRPDSPVGPMSRADEAGAVKVAVSR